MEHEQERLDREQRAQEYWERREAQHQQAEAFYQAKLRQCGVPETMHDGVIDYVLHGLRPGHFLSAVLSNDLCEAVRRGDVPNQAALAGYVQFFANYVPASMWGSPARFEAWLRKQRTTDQQEVLRAYVAQLVARM